MKTPIQGKGSNPLQTKNYYCHIVCAWNYMGLLVKKQSHLTFITSWLWDCNHDNLRSSSRATVLILEKPIFGLLGIEDFNLKASALYNDTQHIVPVLVCKAKQPEFTQSMHKQISMVPLSSGYLKNCRIEEPLVQGIPNPSHQLLKVFTWSS
jgi:hypothetical protein